MSAHTRQKRLAREIKRYPAMLPVGSTYEGCPPYLDAPEPTAADYELAATAVATDRGRYEVLCETLASNPYFLDQLHTLGQDRHMKPSLRLLPTDLIRIAQTLQDCIQEAAEQIGASDLEDA